MTSLHPPRSFTSYSYYALRSIYCSSYLVSSVGIALHLASCPIYMSANDPAVSVTIRFRLRAAFATSSFSSSLHSWMKIIMSVANPAVKMACVGHEQPRGTG